MIMTISSVNAPALTTTEEKIINVTTFQSAREREAAAALTAQYRQIGSGAILAAVLAITRQRELLASASNDAKQAA